MLQILRLKLSKNCPLVCLYIQDLGFMHKRLITAILAVVALGILANTFIPQRTVLEEIIHSGELRVLSRNGATTFYEGPHGPTGLEYDLVKEFADYLGVELKINTLGTLKAILTQVRDGKSNLTAAGLTITEERKQDIRFSPPYQYITQQLVYRLGNKKPKNLREASNGHLEIIANSSHVEHLKALKETQQHLNWTETPNADSLELIQKVAEGHIDYTIVDSNELAMNRRYYPMVRVAFDVTEPEALAWAFPKNQDNSLYDKVTEFFNDLASSGKLQKIIAHNYEHIHNFDYPGTFTYLKHIKRRLPRYQDLFQQAANKNSLDWRLVAAMAYQESHWNPHAVSPTGVRGIMMLTKVTAAHLGITKRTDVNQSIAGGARYVRKLIDMVPYEISESDRTWVALAAYNVGFGHIQDARLITQKRGGDPNKWMDIKDNLPLLRKRKWYRQTQYGYARGKEPVRYVENIRSYYDILTWYNDQQTPQEYNHAYQMRYPVMTEYINPSMLRITSPVL